MARLFVLALAVAALIVAIAFQNKAVITAFISSHSSTLQASSSPSSPSPAPLHSHRYHSIRRVSWPDEYNKLTKLKLSNYPTPLIITNHSSSAWPALQRWTLPYLHSQWPYKPPIRVKKSNKPMPKYQLPNKYYNRKNKQAFTPSSPISHYSDMALFQPGPVEEAGLYRNMSVDEFINALPYSGDTYNKNNNDSVYYYYTHQIFVLDAALRRDLMPFDFRSFLRPLTEATVEYVRAKAGGGKGRGNGRGGDDVPYSPLNIEYNYPDCEFGIWIGSQGVTAWPHEDLVANFFIQLRGEKTFDLVSPEHVDALDLYPSLHEFHRHLQVDWDSPSFAASLDVYRVTLRPGDFLYLPAGWFHKVQSHEEPATLSLNGWCLSDADGNAEYILSRPLPFEGHWAPQWKAQGARIFVRGMMDKLYAEQRGERVQNNILSGKTPAAWYRDMFYQRFIKHGLFNEPTQGFCEAIEATMSGGNKFCGMDRPELSRDIIDKIMSYSHRAAHLLMNSTRGERLADSGDDASEGPDNQEADRDPSSPSSSPSPSLSPIQPWLVGLSSMVLSQLIEEIAQWATGGEYAMAFMKCCMMREISME